MSVTQQQVLDALAKVASPRGVALTNANVLSAITASDGKVFFSINVDAAEARAWESVRAQAEVTQAQSEIERGGRFADAALARGHRDHGGNARDFRLLGHRRRRALRRLVRRHRLHAMRMAMLMRHRRRSRR